MTHVCKPVAIAENVNWPPVEFPKDPDPLTIDLEPERIIIGHPVGRRPLF